MEPHDFAKPPLVTMPSIAASDDFGYPGPVTDFPRSRVLSFSAVSTLAGLVLGWLPSLLHGPIARKFDLLHIDGATAVLGWHVARCSVGLLVGITIWPRRWWLRGPLCGFLALLPLAIVSLATPGCGFT